MFNLQSLLQALKELPKLQKATQDMLAATERITAEGEAGGGLVRARANGRLVLTDLRIDEELLRQPDRELLEALILAACNQALDRVREKVYEQTLGNFAGLAPSFASEDEPTAEQSENRPKRSNPS